MMMASLDHNLKNCIYFKSDQEYHNIIIRVRCEDVLHSQHADKTMFLNDEIMESSHVTVFIQHKSEGVAVGFEETPDSESFWEATVRNLFYYTLLTQSNNLNFTWDIPSKQQLTVSSNTKPKLKIQFSNVVAKPEFISKRKSVEKLQNQIVTFQTMNKGEPWVSVFIDEVVKAHRCIQAQNTVLKEQMKKLKQTINVCFFAFL